MDGAAAEQAAAFDRPQPTLARLLIAGLGMAMIAIAAAADRIWFEGHVLPHMFHPRAEQLFCWRIERALVFIAGGALLWPVSGLAARRVRTIGPRRFAGGLLLIILAVLMSVLTSELVLSAVSWRSVDKWARGDEPLRVIDARFGWINLPGRIGRQIYHGQKLVYAMDRDGRRIGDPATPIDPAKPTILLTGESIMLGFRLNWPDTIAGRLQQATGLQVANLAVSGYGTDQSHMRLADELPHFAHPVAVVAIFVPTLMERNLDHDRPYLDPALHWHDGSAPWRLRRLFDNVALYHSRSAIEGAIAMSRAVLRATVLTAHAHHAEALIVVPSFAPEQPAERLIRQRVLDEAGLPYVRVPLDPRWRVSHDGHPDAAADLAMSQAILAALARRRPDMFGPR